MKGSLHKGLALLSAARMRFVSFASTGSVVGVHEVASDEGSGKVTMTAPSRVVTTTPQP
jgi:hypothetical protein